MYNFLILSTEQNCASHTALASAPTGNGVQPGSAQLVPTLTGSAQLRCDPSETHPTPPAPTLVNLVENLDYHEKFHLGIQDVKRVQTLGQTKQHSEGQLIAPPAAPSLAGSGVQFKTSKPGSAQHVPTLTGGAQLNCAPSEARPTN